MGVMEFANTITMTLIEKLVHNVTPWSAAASSQVDAVAIRPKVMTVAYPLSASDILQTSCILRIYHTRRFR